MEKKMTTADYRKLARQAEKDLNWRLAVEYWEKALNNYPTAPGELSEADKDKIITAINADREMISND